MATQPQGPQEVVSVIANLPVEPQEQTVDQLRAELANVRGELERMQTMVREVMNRGMWRACKQCGVHIGILAVNHDFTFHEDTCDKGKKGNAA